MSDNTCKFCKWLAIKAWHEKINLCANPKIHEAGSWLDEQDYPKMLSSDHDELIYTYDESGKFHVGDNFGCIHFERLGEGEERATIENVWR